MKSTLCDPGEDLHHGVGPVLVVHVHEAENLGTIGHEDTAQELVDEEELADAVDEVERVTKEIPEEKVFITTSKVAMIYMISFEYSLKLSMPSC